MLHLYVASLHPKMCFAWQHLCNIELDTRGLFSHLSAREMKCILSISLINNLFDQWFTL